MEESPHILLVEDNRGVRHATRLFLTTHGYRVTAVGSLSEALGCTGAGCDIDLLITDYHLPDGGTGKQVVDSVRNALGGNFKTLVITGDISSAVKLFDGE